MQAQRFTDTDPTSTCYRLVALFVPITRRPDDGSLPVMQC